MGGTQGPRAGPQAARDRTRPQGGGRRADPQGGAARQAGPEHEPPTPRRPGPGRRRSSCSRWCWPPAPWPSRSLADAGAFPRRHARTRGFTLGRPRGFQVAADGARVAFLRSAAGDDPVNRLWVLDLDGGGERLVADPAALLARGEELPAAERA